jgi:hypothetical protein
VHSARKFVGNNLHFRLQLDEAVDAATQAVAVTEDRIQSRRDVRMEGRAWLEGENDRNDTQRIHDGFGGD